jgi:hypothetical protein
MLLLCKRATASLSAHWLKRTSSPCVRARARTPPWPGLLQRPSPRRTPLSSSRARRPVRPRVDARRRVAAACRRRPPRGRRWPPRAWLYSTAPVPLPPLHSSFALSLSQSLWKTQTGAALTHARHRLPLSPPPRSDTGEPPPLDCPCATLRHLLLSSERAIVLSFSPTVRLNRAFSARATMAGSPSWRSVAGTLASPLSPCVAVLCSPSPRGTRAHSS